MDASYIFKSNPHRDSAKWSYLKCMVSFIFLIFVFKVLLIFEGKKLKDLQDPISCLCKNLMYNCTHF